MYSQYTDREVLEMAQERAAGLGDCDADEAFDILAEEFGHDIAKRAMPAPQSRPVTGFTITQDGVARASSFREVYPLLRQRSLEQDGGSVLWEAALVSLDVLMNHGTPEAGYVFADGLEIRYRPQE